MKRLIVLIGLCIVPSFAQTKKDHPVKRECDPTTMLGLVLGTTLYRGKYVVDQDAMNVLIQQQLDRDKLYWALRTRVLTPEEMERVQSLGTSLITREGEYYSEESLNRQ